MLQPLLGAPEGIHRGCIIIFSTSAPLAVYPNVHFSFNDIFGFERASPSPHENDKSKQIVSIVLWSVLTLHEQRCTTVSLVTNHNLFSLLD